VLYLRDINLPKADKYGTSQVMAFVQQLLTYKGFYDSKLEFVGELGLLVHSTAECSVCQIISCIHTHHIQGGNPLSWHQLKL
jgi:hypothetical protein